MHLNFLYFTTHHASITSTTFNMHCTNCGTEVTDRATFCRSCGAPIGAATTQVATIAAVPPHISASYKSKPIIKCGNCGHVGEGERARRLVFTVLAWLCVVFAPLITIIYFVGTYKYRCPKCKSTFLGIKNNEGNLDRAARRKWSRGINGIYNIRWRSINGEYNSCGAWCSSTKGCWSNDDCSKRWVAIL